MEATTFQAVLRDDYYKEIELGWFCCAFIKDKKKTTAILNKLGSIYPMSNYTHLKRVKDINGVLHILINHIQDHDYNLQDITDSLPFMEDLGPPYIIQIPLHKPLTRQQFIQCQKYWNCHFFEDKRLEKYLAGLMFSQQEVDKHKQYIQLAQSGLEKGVVGALIVDPISDNIIAKSHTSDRHPLGHAVMNCIDMVSVHQGGGSWQHHSTSLLQGEKSSSINSSKLINLVDEDSTIVTTPTKRPKTEAYLCTSYDLYTTHEPCIMCSMALVHSRIGRVFYKHSDKLAGGLGSKLKIHCHTNINHRFEVFRMNIN